VQLRPLGAVKRRFLSLTAASRILSSPFNAFSRLSVQVADDFPEFPLGHQPFLRGLRHGVGNTLFCSAPSSVLRRCQTARQRACKDCGHGPSLTVPPIVSVGTAELSRFSNIECQRMHRFSDSAGPGNDWLNTPLPVSPSRSLNAVGSPD
jgi:hypothetical protein